MKNVFIVGGAGFVGHHLVRRLLADKEAERIVVFDNLSSGKFENVPLGDIRVTFVCGDARDYTDVKAMMKGCEADLVFHLAANPDIARAASEPTIDFDGGTLLTRNVLEAARENGVANVVYFSGSGVYGDRGETWLAEDMAGNPVSPYGAAKIGSEAMLSAYSAMFGMRGLTFRMANIVGPRQTHGVGYDFVRRLKADPTKLVILGNGQQSKSYIHIDDVLNAVIGTIARQGVHADFPKYDVFNVGTDDWISVEDIAQMAAGVMGGSPSLEFGKGRAGWNGDVPVVRLNSSKIQSWGWRCERGSRAAMHDALINLADAVKRH